MEQVALPVPEAAKPGAQAVHVEDPDNVAAVPGGQALHIADPGSSAKYPGVHKRHCSKPDCANVPTLQVRHIVSDASGTLPGEQFWHCAVPVLGAIAPS